MEVALPFVAHMAFLVVALGSFALGVALLFRPSGAQRYFVAPLLLAAGVWLLHSALVRL